MSSVGFDRSGGIEEIATAELPNNGPVSALRDGDRMIGRAEAIVGRQDDGRALGAKPPDRVGRKGAAGARRFDPAYVATGLEQPAGLVERGVEAAHRACRQAALHQIPDLPIHCPSPSAGTLKEPDRSGKLGVVRTANS